MAPSGVVPRLDVSEDRTPRVLPGVPIAVPEQLELEGGEEAFRHRVVISTLTSAHATADTPDTKLFEVDARGVRCAAVGVVDEPRFGFSLMKRHGEGRLA